MRITFRASCDIASMWDPGEVFWKGAWFSVDTTLPQHRIHIQGPVKKLSGAALVFDYGEPTFWMNMGFEPFDEQNRLMVWDATAGKWLRSTEKYTRLYLLMET